MYVYLCMHTFKTKLHLCINSVFRCKLNVFGVCDRVLPREFSLIHLHGFLTALPRSRSRENCLTCITGPSTRSQAYLFLSLSDELDPHLTKTLDQKRPSRT